MVDKVLFLIHQHIHLFLLIGAVRSGGDYVHTFHSADTESVIAGGDYTHVWAGGILQMQYFRW